MIGKAALHVTLLSRNAKSNDGPKWKSICIEIDGLLEKSWSILQIRSGAFLVSRNQVACRAGWLTFPIDWLVCKMNGTKVWGEELFLDCKGNLWCGWSISSMLLFKTYSCMVFGCVCTALKHCSVGNPPLTPEKLFQSTQTLKSGLLYSIWATYSVMHAKAVWKGGGLPLMEVGVLPNDNDTFMAP